MTATTFLPCWRRVSERIRSLKRSRDLARTPRRLRRKRNPRNSKPSLKSVRRVFVSWSESLSFPSTSATKARASAASCRVLVSTTKSSAYLTWRRPLPSRALSSWSRTRFESQGEMTPPCGVPSVGTRTLPSSHTRLQEGLDQIQDTSVGDTGSYKGHHHQMVDPVEEGSNVGIHDVPVTVPCVANHGGDGMMCLASFSKPEAPLRQG